MMMQGMHGADSDASSSTIAPGMTNMHKMMLANAPMFGGMFPMTRPPFSADSAGGKSLPKLENPTVENKTDPSANADSAPMPGSGAQPPLPDAGDGGNNSLQDGQKDDDNEMKEALAARAKATAANAKGKAKGKPKAKGKAKGKADVMKRPTGADLKLPAGFTLKLDDLLTKSAVKNATSEGAYTTSAHSSGRRQARNAGLKDEDIVTVGKIAYARAKKFFIAHS